MSLLLASATAVESDPAVSNTMRMAILREHPGSRPNSPFITSGESNRSALTGHVDQLLARLRRSDETLGGRELLHLMLSHLPQREAALASGDALYERFGSLGGILSASWSRLEATAGLPPGLVGLLKTIQAIVVGILREPLLERPMIGTGSELLDYLRVSLAHNEREMVRLLYLDSRNGLIKDDLHGVGTGNTVQFHPQEVIRRALELGAKALILVHNHPSGDPTPSPQDIQITKQIVSVLSALDIKLHDHLIISGHKHESFRKLGLL